MKNFIESVIRTGNFVYTEMEERIQKMYVLGKLTETEMTELLDLAADMAQDARQVDIYNKLVELEERVFALEHKNEPSYPVWVAGYTTKQGETVLFDYNGDGVLELLRYDGGRSQTALSVGKIDGWHVVDENGNILGDYRGGVFTPIG